MDSQGQSPFAWTTLGGIAARTSTIPIMTGVTALSRRYHPAILARAVATVADMMPGRFSLGIGTGEALNEHVVGEVWPPVSIRQDMLIEPLEIMRSLWAGDYTTIEGQFYEVHNAKLYTLPEQLPQVIVGAGGTGKPKYGQITVQYSPDEEQSAQTALEYWGYTVLGGQASQELSLPKHYQEAIKDLATPEIIKKSVVCGPDAEKYHKKVKAYLDAGFTHVYFHQVGPDQGSFFEFARKELLPKYS